MGSVFRSLFPQEKVVIETDQVTDRQAKLDAILKAFDTDDGSTSEKGNDNDKQNLNIQINDKNPEDDIDNFTISVPEGYCVECGDHPRELRCNDCEDGKSLNLVFFFFFFLFFFNRRLSSLNLNFFKSLFFSFLFYSKISLIKDFCDVCFQSIHKKGSRKTHKTSPYNEPSMTNQNQNLPMTLNGKSNAKEEAKPVEGIHINELTKETTSMAETKRINLTERAKYIPLRLSLRERKYLRLLEAALNVSEYTDKVDILSYSNKTKRIVHQIREICAILSGCKIPFFFFSPFLISFHFSSFFLMCDPTLEGM